MEKQHQFSIGYFLITFLVILAMQNFLFLPHTETLTYSEFKALLKAGKLDNVALSDHVINGTLKTDGLDGLLPKEKIEVLSRPGASEHRFTTVRVEGSVIVAELETAKVRFTGVVASTWFATLRSWILPAFPLAACVFYQFTISPEVAALAMSCSLALVAVNALLLKRARLEGIHAQGPTAVSAVTYEVAPA